MILLIDNYDSFTYNLVQYLGELGQTVKVFRNNKISVAQIKKLKPSKIVISPGPCTPKEAGISNEVIQEFSGKMPLLGVCLGHQCIGYVFGGHIVRAKRIMHGKTSEVIHSGRGILKKLPNPFQATRYHSLLIDKKNFPPQLEITGWTSENEIMAVQHRKHLTFGVQFHPESILTPQGKEILKNFTLIR